MSYTEGGYYPKYKVVNNKTGEEVKSQAFTLIPDRDPHAREAVLVYANLVQQDNPVLAEELKTAFTPKTRIER